MSTFLNPGPVERLARLALQSPAYHDDERLRQAVRDVQGNPLYDAAPELLAACHVAKQAFDMLLPLLDCWKPDWRQTYLFSEQLKVIKAAIAKAEGTT